jgi:hypothetical protein
MFVQLVKSIAKPLVRLLYETLAASELSLITMRTITNQDHHDFLPHTSHFYRVSCPKCSIFAAELN